MKKLLLLGVLVLGLIGALVAIMLPRDTKKPNSHASVAQPNTGNQKKSAPVTVAIPGAKPIPALTQDYSQPSSLWVVVSKDLPLTQPRYAPLSLTKPSTATNTQKSEEEQSLRSDVIPAVESLFAAAKAAGFDLMVASGYRSYELQQTYFTGYSGQYGEEAANKFSARPGQSEHQTGLSLDISLVSRECYLDTCFGKTPAGQWLAAHAYEYGFILRYPEDKTTITKYQYEPWHFRYVGKDLAAALHASGLTLDEAYPYLQTALTELRRRGEVGGS